MPSKELRLGIIVLSSFSSVTPNHWATPFHIESQDVVGSTKEEDN